MNTKEKVIAGVLCAILLWVLFTSTPKPSDQPAGPGPQQTDQVQPPGTPDQPKSPDTTATNDTGSEPAKPVQPVLKPEPTPDPIPTPDTTAGIPLLEKFADAEPAKPHALIIERAENAVEQDPLAFITIDPERGGIIEVHLNDYKQDLDASPEMILGTEDAPMLSLSNTEGTLKFSHAVIVEKTSQLLIIDRQILGTSVVVRQSWEAVPDSFRLLYNLSVSNAADTVASLPDLRMNAGVMDPLVPPKGMFGASGIDQKVQYRKVDEGDSDYERITKIVNLKQKPDDISFFSRLFGEKATSEYMEMEVNWISVQNKFFTTSLFSEEAIKGMAFSTPVFIPEGRDEDNDEPRKEKLHRLIGYANLPELEALPAQGTFDRAYDFYVGPKNYKRLEKLRPGTDDTEPSRQEQIMGFDIFMIWHFGFMKYIALGIYKLLTWLYGIVGNFGFAIVLSTIVIRVLFSPITYKSSVWSQRMKEIQPEMAEIKEKYASDPQQMNMKVMALYRERKVNPVGGCLPIFFQIPVFFALFNVLRSAIELRHAAFLFVSDLSQPDMLFLLPQAIPFLGGIPFNVLPFLMGGAMYLQQRLMPTSADPMQQKMMGFMTIFITFICYNMPAGLTLYWTVSNICSIFQFKITSKLIDKQTKAKES